MQNLNGNKMPAFVVGQGVTEILHTDSRPYTVIAVGKTSITLQQDEARLINGFQSGESDALVAHVGGFMAHVEGYQRYEIAPNLDGFVTKAHWRASRKAFFTSCGKVIAGRQKHHDFNF